MKNLITIAIIISSIFAQGKVVGKTFFDFTSTEDKKGFNFKRQYFGYSLKASENLSFKLLLDVGNTNVGTVEYEDDNGLFIEKPEDKRLTAFLKKAQLDYTCDWGKTSVGLIGMNTYHIQEKNWGYRFIEKSAIDLNKFSSTADLGVAFSTSIINNLNTTIQFVNGEGYKKPQGDEHFKSVFNITYGESKLNKNDGYNIGLVYSSESTDNDPVTMMSVFGGYAGMGLRVGVEYDLMNNPFKTFDETSVISTSLNYGLNDNIDLFARYDMVDDNDTENENGENLLVTGVVFNCGSGLSVAPNMRMVSHEDSNEKLTTVYRVNVQFKL